MSVTHKRRTRGDRLDLGVSAVLDGGRAAVHRASDAAGEALHDAATLLRKSKRSAVARSRSAPRVLANAIGKNPIKALLLFGIGVAAVMGIVGRAQRR